MGVSLGPTIASEQVTGPTWEVCLVGKCCGGNSSRGLSPEMTYLLAHNTLISVTFQKAVWDRVMARIRDLQLPAPLRTPRRMGGKMPGLMWLLAGWAADLLSLRKSRWAGFGLCVSPLRFLQQEPRAWRWGRNGRPKSASRGPWGCELLGQAESPLH